LRADDVNAKDLADDMYNKLTEDHVEVIYDDRAVRPGVMFSDADLLGVPVRVIVSPRNLEESVVEVVTRDKTIQKKVNVVDAVSEIEKLVQQLRH
jgi:prolyl-tRNA synthetase